MPRRNQNSVPNITPDGDFQAEWKVVYAVTKYPPYLEKDGFALRSVRFAQCRSTRSAAKLARLLNEQIQARPPEEGGTDAIQFPLCPEIISL